MSNLTQPQFQNEDEARKYLEALRWPTGPVCPHCAVVGEAYELKGKSARPGLYKCKAAECGQEFTVTVNTVFHRSKVGLHKWLMAAYLMASSKKGISSHQIHRTLGVTYKTAWFMTHRLREAARDLSPAPMGGNGSPVEIDETFWGNESKKPPKARSGQHKMKVFTLVERNGNARSFHVPNVRAKTLLPILKAQLAANATVYSDSAGQYRKLKNDFPTHETVNHMAGEYVRGNVHSNTVESYFSLLKRGLYGTFHHVSEAHLQRYATEFDFRWNNRNITDAERADALLGQIQGKRLLYKGPDSAQNSQ